MDGRAGSAPTIARCHTWSVEASAARARSARTADPWRDTEVIDERAPRFNQAVVGTVALLGAAFGWPLAWALMAAQLFIGLTLGRRFCIPCVAYFELVQPRVGEGELEDSRPPRLANVIGTVFLAAAAAAWWLGASAVGTVLGSMVAALALLAASTGVCVACELYRLTARIRGISARHHARLDPADFDLGDSASAYVEFTHPLCSECARWERRLSTNGNQVVTVDVRKRSYLARKYGVAIVPTVLRVAGDGTVLERLAP
jgi:hypothetical protein